MAVFAANGSLRSHLAVFAAIGSLCSQPAASRQPAVFAAIGSLRSQPAPLRGAIRSALPRRWLSLRLAGREVAGKAGRHSCRSGRAGQRPPSGECSEPREAKPSQLPRRRPAASPKASRLPRRRPVASQRRAICRVDGQLRAKGEPFAAETAICERSEPFAPRSGASPSPTPLPSPPHAHNAPHLPAAPTTGSARSPPCRPARNRPSVRQAAPVEGVSARSGWRP